MATFNLFNSFAQNMAIGNHDLENDTFRLFICNAANAPVVGDTVQTGLTEIAQTNLAGGANPTVDISVSAATDAVVSADKVTLTASGGALPTFRYYGIYNDTNAGKELVCFWDHEADVDLADGESFEIKFDGQDVAGTIMTIGQGTIS